VLDSVRRTGKLLIVHEDALTAGFGAEIAAVAAEEAFTWLDAPVCRLAVPDVPIPYNIRLMDSVIPGVEAIQARMKTLLDF
jgi:2-oxoisovalerate dehydrogenase E1 component